MIPCSQLLVLSCFQNVKDAIAILKVLESVKVDLPDLEANIAVISMKPIAFC